MSRALQKIYLCHACRERITGVVSSDVWRASNSTFTARRSRILQRKYATIPEQSISRPRPLRLAVIGSGPAGFYAAGKVLEKLQDARVDMYEQLPVPYGLVRFGVAPDHPEVKNCQDKFQETAASSRFTFIGNVDVGYSLPLSTLKPHYDAILFAYGASKDKELGIPGEHLSGVYSARAFVGWYNGLPEYADLAPQLDSGENAVIVGQGNVALDVARILLSNVDDLRHTDITDAALDTLSSNRVRTVTVVGRRGPLQAPWTIKEVRELMKLSSVAFHPFERALLPTDLKSLARPKRRIAELLLQGSANHGSHAIKSWGLEFLRSPKSFNASTDNMSSLASTTFTHTRFRDGADPFDPTSRVIDAEAESDIPSQLAFRSIGYKSTALPALESELGVPFDSATGIIPNDRWGRVLSTTRGPGELTAGHVPGMYCAGWVKRGPTGVIASTMDDAFTTADIIVRDWADNATFMNSSRGSGGGGFGTGLGWDGVKQTPPAQNLQPVSWKDWQRLDAEEQERGKLRGKPREKFRSVSDMLRFLNQ